MTNFSPPKCRAVRPLPVLLRGLTDLPSGLYEPESYFRRAFRSLEVWRPRATQRPPSLPMSYNLRVFAASLWTQGFRSHYRRAYWRFLGRIIRNWSLQPPKACLGFIVLGPPPPF